MLLAHVCYVPTADFTYGPQGHWMVATSPLCQGLPSEIFPNYSRVAVDTHFTRKEFGCQLFMPKGWTLESWQEGVRTCLGQELILKESPPVAVCSVGTHGCSEVLDDRIKGTPLRSRAGRMRVVPQEDGTARRQSAPAPHLGLQLTRVGKASSPHRNTPEETGPLPPQTKARSRNALSSR